MEISMTDSVNTTPQQSAAEAGPNLNIADLVNVLHIINTCASRGVFQASELSSVGGLYDRLHAFLTASGALNQTNQKPDATQ